MYSDIDLNNNACRSSDPTTAGMPSRGSVKCDSGAMVAGATCLITGASGTTPDCGVCFPCVFFITTDAFAPGQVLNFGSLAYVTDYYTELCPLHEAVLAGNKPLVSPPLLGLLGADLEVLARQIRCGLGPNPTVPDHH